MRAWQMMLTERDVTISLQAAATGLSRSQILDQQNASSGVWAFSGLNVMYLFALSVEAALRQPRGPES